MPLMGYEWFWDYFNFLKKIPVGGGVTLNWGEEVLKIWLLKNGTPKGAERVQSAFPNPYLCFKKA